MYVDVVTVNKLAVQLHVYVDSVDTSRGIISGVAESSVNANLAKKPSVQSSVRGDTFDVTNTSVADSVNVNHVNQPSVHVDATGDTSENSDTVVSESADVNHVAQLNVHDTVNMARLLSTDESAVLNVSADSVRRPNVQLHVNVDSVDISRNSTNTDAESNVDANRVSLLNACQYVNMDASGTKRNTNINASSNADVWVVVNRLDAQEIADMALLKDTDSIV